MLTSNSQESHCCSCLWGPDKDGALALGAPCGKSERPGGKSSMRECTLPRSSAESTSEGQGRAEPEVPGKEGTRVGELLASVLLPV